MTPYISDFVEILPRMLFSQTAILKWLSDLHALEGAEGVERIFAKLGLKEGKIEERRFEMETDFLSFVPIEERVSFIDKTVTRIFEEFYKGSSLPAELIHVSCTAYVSPSGAQKIVSKRREKTKVTHAYHMGCYGSIPALRMASGFFNLHGGKIDIAHTELCSLHLNPSEHTLSRLIIHSLFADGFIKYSMGAEEKGFKLLALHEEILPDSSDSMFWAGGDWGKSFFIGKEVPRLIQGGVLSLVETLSLLSHVDPETALFAIHPGGPKIVNQIAEKLNLKEHQTRHTYQILKSRGNMSSATLPHIWEKILKDPEVKPETPVISLAFGPGINLTGAVLEKCGSF